MQIHHHIHNHPDPETGRLLKQLKTLIKRVMAKLSEIQEEFESFKQVIAEEKQQIANKLQEMQNSIDQLNTNLQDGGSSEERAALLANIQAAKEDMKTIIPDLPPPNDGSGEGTGSGETV